MGQLEHRPHPDLGRRFDSTGPPRSDAASCWLTSVTFNPTTDNNVKSKLVIYLWDHFDYCSVPETLIGDQRTLDFCLGKKTTNLITIINVPNINSNKNPNCLAFETYANARLRSLSLFGHLQRQLYSLVTRCQNSCHGLGGAKNEDRSREGKICSPRMWPYNKSR